MKSAATVGLSMTMVILLFLFLCATNRKQAPVAPCLIGQCHDHPPTKTSPPPAKHAMIVVFLLFSRTAQEWVRSGIRPVLQSTRYRRIYLQSTRYSVLLSQSTRARTPTALPECRKRHVCTGCKPFQIRFPPTRSARSFCMHPGDTVAVSSQ